MFSLRNDSRKYSYFYPKVYLLNDKARLSMHVIYYNWYTLLHLQKEIKVPYKTFNGFNGLNGSTSNSSTLDKSSMNDNNVIKPKFFVSDECDLKPRGTGNTKL